MGGRRICESVRDGKVDVGCSIRRKEVDAKENCGFGELTYLYIL